MKKLLFDISELLRNKGKETGICRVAMQVLRELSKYAEYEIYPLVPFHTQMDVRQYLTSKGLKNLADHIVSLPNLRATCDGYKRSYCIKAKILRFLFSGKYGKELKKYDEYFSIFFPVSPLVYRAHLKVWQVIHDLFPINFPTACDQKFIQKCTYWMKNAYADEFICNSKYTQKDFLEFRPDVDASKTKVVFWAADDRFKPTPNNEIRSQYNIKTPQYFLGVSDHNPRKNFVHLIQSFVAFLKTTRIQDVSLVLAGPQKQFDEIKKMVGSLGELKDRIILTGFVPDEDLPALYSEAELFIYPSLYEGFGLPILEAMQCGTPVLTCNNTSLPEVGGEAVSYISGKDITETVQKLIEIHQDSEKRKEMSLAGLERAAQFNWQTTVDQIFNLNRGELR